MTMGDQVTVTMTGGGPYGFRLFGGDNIPLSVAKIRRRSKSADAGLCEGDILLGINGYSCRGINHATAMALAESSGDMLVFQVLRGADDQQSVESAYSALGGQLGDIPASALQASSRPQPPMINSHVTPASQYHRQEQTYQEGDTTTRVTQETRTEAADPNHFRQTTVTQKVSTTNFGQRAVSPRAASPLHPRAVSPLQPRPNTWQPTAQQNTSSHTSTLQVHAPSAVGVQHHPDRSVTMTFGIDASGPSKENVAPRPAAAPAPMFKVSKVTNAQANGTWAPGSGGGGYAAPKPAPTQQPARTPSPRFNVQQKWQPAPRKPSPKPEPELPKPAPPQQVTMTVDLGADVRLTPSDFRNEMQHPPQVAPPMTMEPQGDGGYGDPPLPLDIQKLMFGSRPGHDDSERSTPDSPATFMRKKKIYADSSFYDDPEHKYPTIEEQIKMARTVALSLMAPQNKRARGHTMFMKRRQGASRWIAGEEMPLPQEDHVDAAPVDEGEKYYRPAPWMAKSDSGWRPVGMSAPKPYALPQKAAPPPQSAYQPPAQPTYQPPPQQTAPPSQQQPPADPYVRGWGQPDIRASTWGHQEPQWGAHDTAATPVPQQQQQQAPPPQRGPTPGYAPVKAPGRGPLPSTSLPAQSVSPKPHHTWQPNLTVAPQAPPQQPPQPQGPPQWGTGATSPAAQPQPQGPPQWGMGATSPAAQQQPQQPAWEAPPAPPAAPEVPAAPAPPPPPPAPPLPDESMKTMWRSSVPELEKKGYDDFEKVRILGQKNMHNQVSPQMCFSLANDLRNMKGKGGKLFAKRRARAEQWVVDEQPNNSGPDQKVMEKIAGQVAMEKMRQSANMKIEPKMNSGDPANPPKARLQEMIAKPAMTPWDAAAGGNIDAAFSHLNKRSTIHGDSLVSQGWQPPKAPAGPSSSSSQPIGTNLLTLSGQSAQPSFQSKKPDYTRKIQGWSTGNSVLSPAPVNNLKPMSAPSFNAKQTYGAPAQSQLATLQQPSVDRAASASPRLRIDPAPDAHPAAMMPSPAMGAASPYQTPPQRLSPMPQAAQAAARATNGEVFFDAHEGLPAGITEGNGYSDL